jgi:membrane-bound metal-dependent hydrolase YbcI (DUF457 family)
MIYIDHRDAETVTRFSSVFHSSRLVLKREFVIRARGARGFGHSLRMVARSMIGLLKLIMGQSARYDEEADVRMTKI